MTQPDGSSLVVIPSGDEYNLFWELQSGVTVVQGKDGWWAIAKLDGAGRLVAGERIERGLVSAESAAIAGRHLRPTRVGFERGDLRPIPPHARSRTVRTLGVEQGNEPVLVILVEFSDRAPVAATADDFRDAFFGPTKSVAEYYREATFGRLVMSPAAETQGTAGDGIVGWLKLNMKHPNNGISNSTTATDQQKNEAAHNSRLAVKAAIEAADPYVDFSAYDVNHDGAISRDELAIVVITAGWEASFGGYRGVYSPATWGHRWVLDGSDQVGTVSAPVLDGVTVASYRYNGGYATFGEWMQTTPGNGHRSTIGVMVHELGHDTLGLPDLYDTDGSSEGIGGWGLMGGGSWGSDNVSGSQYGDTPVLLCAWSRVATSIARPTDLTGSGIATVSPAYMDGSVLRLGSGVDNEYFLLEYRVAEGFDAGLRRWDGGGFQSGGGLAIWHIDEAKDDNSQEGHTADAHRKVDLEEADGLNGLDGSTNVRRVQLFYTGGATRFADDTVPPATRYDGSNSGIAVGDVGTAEASGISFSYVAPNAVGFAADSCDHAIDVSLAPGDERTLGENLSQATGGDTPALCAPLSATAWYHVLPERTGVLTVKAGGFDTVAAVLAGACGTATVLGCNDDSPVSADAPGSLVSDIPVQRGVPVSVVIGRYGFGDGGGGTLTGSIALSAAPQYDVTGESLSGCPNMEWVFDVTADGAPVTGLTRDEVHLTVDGAAVAFDTLEDLGGGRYRLATAQLIGGASSSHAVRVEIDTAERAGEVEASLSEAGTACAGLTNPTGVLVIPAAAHLAGDAGTNWRTDLFESAAGNSTESADVAVQYLAHGVSNNDPPQRVFTVPRGGRSVADAAASLFGVAAGKGALVVEWKARTTPGPSCEVDCQPRFLMTSRTYNLLGAGNAMGLPAGATFGQEIPAVPLDRAIPAGGERWLTGLVQQAGGERTNVGLVAAGDTGAGVDLDFFAATGALILSRHVSLGPWGYQQLDRVLEAVGGDVPVAALRVRTSSASAPVVVYASVVDGVTGDPVALLPDAASAAQWFVPSAAHVTGVNDTNWRTDLSITNPGASSVSVTLAFLENGHDNTGAGESAPIVLPAHGSTRIVNVLPTVFNRYGVKGAIRVSATAGVVVASRTYNLLLAGNQWGLPAGATFGQSVPGVASGSGVTAQSPGFVPGVVRTGSARSNLVLLNTGTAPASVTIRLLDARGAPLGAAVMRTLQGLEYAQINDIVGEAGVTGDVTDATLEIEAVTGSEPVVAFLSVVDNRTGDPVTRMAAW